MTSLTNHLLHESGVHELVAFLAVGKTLTHFHYGSSIC